MGLTPMQEFYKDKTIFLTGGTGFLGSAIIEKLLRSCSLKKIFLLIRKKKGVGQEDRYEKILSSAYFDRAKQATPNYKEIINIINGDLLEEKLGLSQEIIDKLTKEVDVVIHCAATVRFDEPLRIATQINIKALNYIIELSKQFFKLKSFVHISTCYSNCVIPGDVYEKFYDNHLPEPQDFINYIDNISDEFLAEKESTIIKNYPNTYTFTKSVGEKLVKREAGNLPICIVRPSIVMGCNSEPIIGWGGDNLFGPYAFMMGTAAGVVRVILSDEDILFDIVPVDMTTNCILAAAYNKAQTKEDHAEIYHISTSKRNPLTFYNFLHWTMCCALIFPPTISVWLPMAITTKCEYAYKFYSFFLHTIPGYLLDAGLKVSGNKPMFVKLYKKANTIQMVLKTFMTTSWTFHDDNTKELYESLTYKDQKVFNFDVREVDWITYLICNCRNMRINIMKDPMSTLRAGIRKREIMATVNKMVLVLFCFFIYYLIRTFIY